MAIRTPDLRFTDRQLYQLSYRGSKQKPLHFWRGHVSAWILRPRYIHPSRAVDDGVDGVAALVAKVIFITKSV